jgi:hypothetical protein
MDFELHKNPEDSYVMDVVYDGFRIGQVLFNGKIWRYRTQENPALAPYDYDSAIDAGHGLLTEIGDVEKFIYGIGSNGRLDA